MLSQVIVHTPHELVLTDHLRLVIEDAAIGRSGDRDKRQQPRGCRVDAACWNQVAGDGPVAIRGIHQLPGYRGKIAIALRGREHERGVACRYVPELSALVGAEEE